MEVPHSPVQTRHATLRRSLHDGLLAERGDPISIVTEFCEQPVSVLPQVGRRAQRQWLVHANWRRHSANLAEARMLGIHYALALGHERIIECLLHVVDRRSGHAAAKTLQPLLRGRSG